MVTVATVETLHLRIRHQVLQDPHRHKSPSRPKRRFMAGAMFARCSPEDPERRPFLVVETSTRWPTPSSSMYKFFRAPKAQRTLRLSRPSQPHLAVGTAPDDPTLATDVAYPSPRPSRSSTATQGALLDSTTLENGENGGERKGSGRDHGHGLLIGQGPSEGGPLKRQFSISTWGPGTGRPNHRADRHALSGKVSSYCLVWR